MKILKFVFRKWLAIARPIGNFQAQVILSLFYFIFFAPIGVIFNLFLDPLRVKRRVRSNFEKWEHVGETLESARKQY